MSFSLTSNFLLNARGLSFLDGGGVTWSLNKNTNVVSAVVSAQTISVENSITGAGTATSPLQLSGDSASPGNSKYYGTNGSGTKGWFASASIPVEANPSATIGLTATNGSTGNFMDAGSAPALSQAIVPTWAGAHTFKVAPTVSVTRTSGTNATVVTFADNVTGAQTAGFGIQLVGSSNAGGVEAVVAFEASATGTNNESQVSVYAQPSAGNLRRLATFASATITFGNTTDNPVYKFTGSGGVTVSGALGVNGNSPPAQSTGWGTPTGGSVVNNYAGGVSATLLSTSDALAQIITVLKQVGILGV